MSIPHQAIVNVQIRGEVCERLPTGQVGKPKSKVRRVSRLYTVVGNSLEECEQKAEKLLRSIEGALDDRT